MELDDFERIKTDEAPPKWKEGMLLLMMLFPIVMLELKYLYPVIGEVNLSVKTFIGNTISVALLYWPLMPFITYCFKWWLISKSNLKVDLMGLSIILILYILEILIFWI
jgi:antibiotic biosynthesis monooxygenase (ABM) superfamily enzyme